MVSTYQKTGRREGQLQILAVIQMKHVLILVNVEVSMNWWVDTGAGGR